MRNLFCFLLFLGCFLSFYACEDVAKNPGDYNLKSELVVTGVKTKSGVEIPMNTLRTIDSTYVRFYEKPDTLKDENGEYVVNEKGEYTIKKDTIYYNGRITAKFVEMEEIILDTPADTIYISLESNAKWLAPMPSTEGRVKWFNTQRLAGGGDGNVVADVTRNRNKRRPVTAIQYILTSDSTIMYKLSFNQKGESE